MRDLPGWQLARNVARARDKRRSLQTRPGLESLDVRILPTGGVSASYAVTGSWTSGFQAELDLTNSQSTAVANWRLGFTLAANITSIWNATIVSHTGNAYVIQGASWDTSLPAGQTTSIGFVANASAVATPTNYTLNGAPLGGSTPTPPAVPTVSIGTASLTEPATGTSKMAFTVSLSKASTSTVVVKYATADGTAKAGTDYTSTQGTLTFAPGTTSQTITVPITGGVVGTSSKTFTVNLSSPTGATLATAQGLGTIVDNISPPQSGNFQYTLTSDWGSGFQGQISFLNTSTTPLSGWTLQFTFPVQITSVWDATLVSHVGNVYVVKSAGWNDTIAAGAYGTFGFLASPGGQSIVPSNYVLSGSTGSSGGGGTSSGQGPTAVNDSAWTYENQAVAINVLSNDTDASQLALSVQSYTQGQNGKVTANTDGTLEYTPKTGFTGADSFTYVVTDSKGGTATATVTVNVDAPATGNWPTQVFAPYVDMTLYPTYNLASAVQNGGVKYFSLAFIVADSQNQPSWGGYTEYAVNGGSFDLGVRSQIAAVRAAGGDVAVSFGGAANQELAEVITSVSALQGAYQSVVNAYQLTHIDFDIEGAAVADKTAIDRRSQALAGLQQSAAAAGKPLDISFTLPVLPTGLTADGLYVLQSALKYGVKISTVNGMAMDYGDSAAPNPSGKMGQYAIQVANSLYSQLQTLYGSSATSSQLWGMIGITPMIGLNDDTSEVFDFAAAQQLVTFAEQKGIGRLSMWSLNRDQENSAGAINYVDNMSSSLVQTPYQFSKLFLTYEN